MVMMPPWIMYEEIRAAFPEAKFLLTISDAESWFENFSKLQCSELVIEMILCPVHFGTVCLEIAQKWDPGAAILRVPVQKTRTLA